MAFERHLYYSLTDIKQKFKLKPQQVEALINANNLPVIEQKITYGTYYSITAKYILKTDFDALVNYK